MNEMNINGKTYFLFTVDEVNKVIISAINELNEYKTRFEVLRENLAEEETENLASFNNNITNTFIKEYVEKGLKGDIPLKFLYAILVRLYYQKDVLDGYDLHDVIVTDRPAGTVRDVLSLFLEIQQRKNAPLADTVRLIPFCDLFLEW